MTEPARGLPLLSRFPPLPPGILRQRVPLLLAVSGWVVLGVIALLGPGTFRAAVVFAFTFICPGAALVRLLPLRGFLERAVLSVAVGLSLATLVAQALAIGHPMRPALVLAVLASLCTVAAVAEIAKGVKEG